MAGLTFDPYTVTGRSGLKRSNGYIYADWLPQLNGATGRNVWQEMATHPIIKGGLRAFELLARQPSWTVTPADATRAAVEVAEFVGSCLDDMTETWDATISGILEYLVYGWAWNETQFKRRNGPVRGSVLGSAFGDGRIGVAQLASRNQTSLVDWVYTGDDLTGLRQTDWATGRQLTVARAKSCHFRTSSAGGSPEGESVLRAAYRSWVIQRRIQEIEAIGIERDLAGMPRVKVPVEYLFDDAPAGHREIVARLRDMVQKVRRNELDGLVVPSQYDVNGHELFEFGLIASAGSRQFDTGKVIDRYNAEIAVSMLTDFLLLGHAGTGGLGQTGIAVGKDELFAAAVTSYLDGIAAELNTMVVGSLVELNGWPVELTPTLVHGPVRETSIGDVVGIIKDMSAAGAALFPDRVLEDALLARVGMDLPRGDDDETGGPPIWQRVGLPALVDGGLLTPNEARTELARGPIPDGDLLRDPVAGGVP